MFRIGIHPDEVALRNGSKQSLSKRWVQRLREDGHEPLILDANQPEFFEQVAGCDGFMWTYTQWAPIKHFGRRLVAALEHGMGLPVFPSWKTAWSFDDKIGQYYLLRAAGIPTPDTRVFWFRRDAIDFCRGASYPLVVKLAAGIMSDNVRMLLDFAEAEYWIDRAFGGGLAGFEKPQLAGLRDIRRRGRGALRLMVKGLAPDPDPYCDLQRGYFLVQEFLPGNDHDTRITVIGRRAFAFRRFNRPGDFRASGSGRIDWDPTKIDPHLLRLAFDARRKLQSQSLAVDAMYKDGRPTLIEISYIYDTWAVEACPGHWEAGAADGGADDLKWVEGRMWPEDAILADFLSLVEGRRAGRAERWPAGSGGG
jgi:hypothetical protein